jgi:hypothetical protein
MERGDFPRQDSSLSHIFISYARKDFDFVGFRNEVFHSRGIENCFFFIRIQNRDVIRVEIPNRLAHDPSCLDLIHSSILKDSLDLGYSYALAMAPQEVAISLEIAHSFHELAAREYVSNEDTYTDRQRCAQRD